MKTKITNLQNKYKKLLDLGQDYRKIKAQNNSDLVEKLETQGIQLKEEILNELNSLRKEAYLFLNIDKVQELITLFNEYSFVLKKDNYTQEELEEIKKRGENLRKQNPYLEGLKRADLENIINKYSEANKDIYLSNVKELNSLKSKLEPQQQKSQPQQNNINNNATTNKKITKKIYSSNPGVIFTISDLKEGIDPKTQKKCLYIKGVRDDGVPVTVKVKHKANKEIHPFGEEEWNKLINEKARLDAKNANLEEYKKQYTDLLKQHKEMVEKKVMEFTSEIEKNENETLIKNFQSLMEDEKFKNIPQMMRPMKVIEYMANDEVLKELGVELQEGETFEAYIDKKTNKENLLNEYLEEGHIAGIGSIIRMGGISLIEIIDENGKVIEVKIESAINPNKPQFVFTLINDLDNKYKLTLNVEKIQTAAGVEFFNYKLHEFDKTLENVKWLIERGKKTNKEFGGIKLSFYAKNFNSLNESTKKILNFFNIKSEEFAVLDTSMVNQMYDKLFKEIQNNPELLKTLDISIPIKREVDIVDYSNQVAAKIATFSNVSKIIEIINNVVTNKLVEAEVFGYKKAKEEVVREAKKYLAKTIEDYLTKNPFSAMATYNIYPGDYKDGYGFIADNIHMVNNYLPAKTYEEIDKVLREKFRLPLFDKNKINNIKNVKDLNELLANEDIGEGLKEVIQYFGDVVTKNRAPDIDDLDVNNSSINGIGN